MKARYNTLWQTACLILSWLFLFPSNFAASSIHAMEHYRGLRFVGVVAQTDWFTCGPAAVATLLTYYYDLPTTEAEMLEAALRSGLETGSLYREQGLSMLSLKHALQEKGIASQGYRVTLDSLAEYYERGGLPVILHVTEPQLHYVVAVGMIGNEIVLADPSLGMYALPVDGLVSEKGFSGTILVPLPDPSFISIVTARQAKVLNQYAERQAQLEALRRRF